MFWTSRQALVHLLINSTAVGALPSCFTVALPSNTGTMAWAAGIRAVHCKLTAKHVVQKWTELHYLWKNCVTYKCNLSFEVTISVSMKTALFWDMILCSLVQRVQNMPFHCHNNDARCKGANSCLLTFLFRSSSWYGLDYNFSIYWWFWFSTLGATCLCTLHKTKLQTSHFSIYFIVSKPGFCRTLFRVPYHEINI